MLARALERFGELSLVQLGIIVGAARQSTFCFGNHQLRGYFLFEVGCNHKVWQLIRGYIPVPLAALDKARGCLRVGPGSLDVAHTSRVCHVLQVGLAGIAGGLLILALVPTQGATKRVSCGRNRQAARRLAATGWPIRRTILNER
jgi:hypothetical protein